MCILSGCCGCLSGERGNRRQKQYNWVSEEGICLISVDPARLYSASETMKEIFSELTAYQESLSALARRLTEIRGMDEICPLLWAVANDVSDEAELCRKLCQGIDAICGIYGSCEGKIVDRFESTQIHYPQPPVVSTDLSCARTLLRELSFTLEGGEMLCQQNVFK